MPFLALSQTHEDASPLLLLATPVCMPRVAMFEPDTLTLLSACGGTSKPPVVVDVALPVVITPVLTSPVAWILTNERALPELVAFPVPSVPSDTSPDSAVRSMLLLAPKPPLALPVL